MNLTKLDQFEPEPAPPIKKQPLKVAGLVAVILLTAPLWGSLMLLLCISKIADSITDRWNKITGYIPNPSSTLHFHHTHMPDGSDITFVLTKPPARKLSDTGDT